MENNILPSFFNYNTEDKYLTDNGYETLLDFFLSWTLRCSEEKYQKYNPVLYEYSRKAVYGLIYGNNNDNYFVIPKIDESFKVLEVKTRRQWRKIDLLVELTVFKNSEEKHYILNIENKWYSNLSDLQLKTYKNIVESHFDLNKFNIINLFVTIDSCRGDNYEKEKRSCRENNYKFLTAGDIQKCMELKSLTGNDFFDEYWFTFLKYKMDMP